MRELGKRPRKTRRMTWPEVYQRSEALLNQGKLDELVNSINGFGPRPLNAAETMALGVYERRLSDQYDEIMRLQRETEAELAEADPSDAEYANSIKESLKEIRKTAGEINQKYTAANNAFSAVKTEQGRALAANAALFGQDDFSFLGMKKSIQQVSGVNDLSPETIAELHEIADLAKDLDQDGRDMLWSALKAQAEKKIKDILFGDKVKRAGGGARRLTDYHKKYLNAMAHLEAWHDSVGGTLIGITGDEYGTWNKALFDILLYHKSVNPDLTAEEALAALTKDVNTYLEADEQTVARILTGYEKTWDVNRHDEVLKGGRDLRSQILTDLQIGDLLVGKMPGKTGPDRGDPSDTLREKRHVRDVLKNDLAEENGDPRKLQSRQKRWMKWYDNRINDLKKEIAAGERLPQSKKTLELTEEMKEKRAEYEALIAERDRVCGPKLSAEEAEKILDKRLLDRLRRAHDKLDAARHDDFRTNSKDKPNYTEFQKAVLNEIEETNRLYQEEKRDRLNYGKTAEELKKYNDNRLATRTKRVQYWQALTAPNADRSVKKRPPIPMTAEQQKEYDLLGDQMKKLRRRVMQMREEERSKTWLPVLRGLRQHFKFLTGVYTSGIASYDRSAVLRQALKLSMAHPKLAFQSYVEAERAAWNPKHFEEANGAILDDPLIREAIEKFGLKIRSSDISSVHDVELFSAAHNLADAPRWMKKTGELVGKIPVAGAFARGFKRFHFGAMENSERHYVTYLNLMSSQAYRALCDAVPGGANDFQKRKFAGLVNMLTGTGAMSGNLRSSITNINDTLGHAIWSPQLWISQVQQAVGADVWGSYIGSGANGNGKVATMHDRNVVAIEAAKLRARATLATLLIGFLIEWLCSDDDEWEEFKRANLMKKFDKVLHPVVGHTHIDLEMGQRTFNRFISSAITGEKETMNGRKVELGSYGVGDIGEQFGHYFFGKLAPTYGNLVSWIRGRDYVGKEFGYKELLLSALPLVGHDAWEAAVNNSWLDGSAEVALVAVFGGAGGNAYEEPYYKRAYNQFKELTDAYDKADKEGRANMSDNEWIRNRSKIQGKIDIVKIYEKQIKAVEKHVGKDRVPKSLTDGLEQAEKAALKALNGG